MKSIRRGQGLITLFITIFIIGMFGLVWKILSEAEFYMTNADEQYLGKVYDRRDDVLFDGIGVDEYEDNHFIDVGNIIGDAEGQMSNTLVARNKNKLNNYSFSSGIRKLDGKAAIYTTLDHYANRKVFDTFGWQRGCVVAYNYKTGEILVCTSLPSLDVTKGYENIDNFENGTLISKTLYGTVPGSTQKVLTLAAAIEIMGADTLFSKSFQCTGRYTNLTGNDIICHNAYGHGTLNIQEAIEKSCNPFFAQLVEDNDMPVQDIKLQFSKMGYALNGADPNYLSIDGILCQTASTTIEDTSEFNTQWGCIGQGDTLVSPMQIMMWQSAIANETGRVTLPHFIDHITNVDGEVTERAETEYGDRVFSPSTAETVKQILLTNGKNNYSISLDGYEVGVKSGTAQVKDGEEENSLLAGFVDDFRHPIAFCILIENKNSGYLTTEAVAKTLLDALCH